MIKKIILIFLLWRIFLFFPLIIGSSFIPYNTASPYTNIWKFVAPYSPVDNFLIYPWANFDGVHYLSIAGEGYAKDGSNSKFFPLYPLLVNVLSKVFGQEKAYGSTQFFTALIISNIFFLIALFVFYKLIAIDFSKKIAFSSIIFLLVFPTSFYFASIYSESLFLLLALLSFYFARKRNWILASFFGMLLSATRIVGVSIFPVLVYEFITSKKSTDKLSLFRFFSLLITPLGFVFYSIFNYLNWQNPFYFLLGHDLQNGRSVNSLILPLQTLFRYLKIFIILSIQKFEWWVAFFEVSVFVFVIFLLYISYKKKIHFSYALFSVFCFASPSFSGTFSSLPRYSVILFPIFIAISLVNNKVIKNLYFIVSVILLIILLSFFSRGYFVS